MSGIDDDIRLVRDLVSWTGANINQISKRIGVANTTLNRFANGTTKGRLHRDTIAKLRQAYPDFPAFTLEADLPAPLMDQDYLPIEILPTFAGLGGGGTGDSDRAFGLISRRLIEEELRGKPADFMLIEARGDSMEPDFQHDDCILIDRRDRNPSQPGPFALWDGDSYVIKNVERISGGIRVFSTNGKYRERMLDPDEVQIMGRLVWFARRV